MLFVLSVAFMAAVMAVLLAIAAVVGASACMASSAAGHCAVESYEQKCWQLFWISVRNCEKIFILCIENYKCLSSRYICFMFTGIFMRTRYGCSACCSGATSHQRQGNLRRARLMR